MAPKMLLPIVLVFFFSARVAAQENKIPDQAREILEKATRFELLSIGYGSSTKNRPEGDTKEGFPKEDFPKEDFPKEDFHGWRVIGKTTINDPDIRKRLVAALEKGVEENKGDSMKCFDPRHGVRVTRDGMTADFVICFQCFQAIVYVAGEKEQRFLITDSPAPVFNQTLRDAKIPLAREPGKKS
jgi:hypothetical protein